MIRKLTLLAVGSLLALASLPAQVPQLISYQGRVTSGTTNFHGTGQFKFALVGTNQAGGLLTLWSHDGTGVNGGEPSTSLGLEVNQGLFTVLLGDATLAGMRLLPATIFTNPEVRLRVWFADGPGPAQRLTPDQRLAAVGYALMAANVADGVVTAAKLADGAVTSAKLAPGAIGTNHLAAGQVVKSLNGLKDDVVLAAGSNVTLATVGNTLRIAAAGGATNAWTLAGNSGSGGGFLGTVDNQALDLRVNNARALRLEPNASSPNLIGGSGGNTVASGVMGASIGGGGNSSEPNTAGTGAHYATIGGGRANQVGASSDSASVGGGVHNIIATNAPFATIGGGIWNTVQTNAHRATIGGGDANIAAGSVATIGGGYGNNARGQDAVIGGGSGNSAWGFRSVIGGGAGNVASNYASTVPGGTDNAALGDSSLAAGHRAKANHPGAFVWADATESDFGSGATNEFALRAGGGVRLVTPTLQVTGGQILGNGGGLSNLSGAALVAGSITGAQLAPGAVSNVNLAAGAVQASNIAPGVVGPNQLTRRYDAGRVEVGAAAPYQGTLNPDGSLSVGVPFNFAFSRPPIVTLGLEETELATSSTPQTTVSGKTLTNFTLRAQGVEPIRSVVYAQAGPASLDSQNDVGDYNSVAWVGGVPAMSCYDRTRTALVFTHALDNQGSSWLPPLVVDAGPNVGTHTALLAVSNLPAIAYLDFGNGALKYVRALNAEGTAWGTPKVVSTNAGGYVSLALVEGRPAVAFVSLQENQLAYVRALDGLGANWGPALLLDTNILSSHPSLAVVNGRPAIAYHDASPDLGYGGNHDSLKFIRAQDTVGGAWNPPTTIKAADWVSTSYTPYKSLGYGKYASLCVVNGKPAVVCYCQHYHASDNYLDGVTYFQANDADGLQWLPMVVPAKGDYKTQGSHLAGKTTMGQNTRLTVVENVPVITFTGSMYHRADSASPEQVTPLLAFGRSLDANGQSWAQCFVVHWGTTLPSLAALNGQPGIGFYKDRRLNFFHPTSGTWQEWPNPTVIPLADPEPVGLLGQCLPADNVPLVLFHDPAKGDLKAVRATNATGTGWSSTPVPVDTGGNAGRDSSALFADGAMAIAYRDTGRSHLRFVRGQGTAWSLPVAVDDPLDDGMYPSLAVVWSTPAVAYYDARLGDLKYTRALTADGSSWGHPLNLDSTGSAGLHPSLAMVADAPAIAYLAPSLKYVRAVDRYGGKWASPVTITTNASTAVGHRPGLAVVNGQPAVAFCAKAGGLFFVRASDATGNTWGTPVKVDADPAVGEFCSLTIVSNYPAIAYYDRGYGDLMYAVALDPNGASWASPVVVDGSSDVGPYASLCDLGDRPAIAYWAATTGDLKYAEASDRLGKTWSTPLALDSTGTVGEGACLVFDGDTAAISYYDRTAGALKVATQGWTIQVVDGGSSVGKHLSVALVGGRPAVSHYDESEKRLRFALAANTAGTSWSTPVTVDSGPYVGMYTSLAEVSTNPAIAYYDQAAGNLKYVRAANATGTTWAAPVTPDTDGDVGRFTSLAVVNGRPAIAYYDATRGDLKFVRANDTTGATWGASVTPDPGDVGQDVGQYASLAVINGKPAIAYYDVRFGEMKFIRATDADGAHWDHYQALDKTDDVGRFVTLRVVGGKPAISYYSVTAGDLKLLRARDADGTTWEEPQTLDSAGDVGRFAVLNEVNGVPSVTYWDYSNGRLKNYYPIKSFLLNWFAIEP